MNTLSDRALKKLTIALTLYITSLIAANTLGLKLMPFLFGTHLSVAVFSFPFVFLTTDVVGEVYGKGVAKFFVYAGILANLLFLLYSIISLPLPWSHDAEWVRTSYGTVFGVSARFAVASLAAFAIAEYQDVWSFFLVRKWMKGRFFWFSSFLSNVWSQLLDTVIFMMIALYGVYSFEVFVKSIIAWWLYKVAMGALYTPLSYVGLKLLRSGEPTSSAPVAE